MLPGGPVRDHGAAWALSAAERHRLVTAVVAAARGKCQVIAHTGHHSVTETIELTQQAEAAGADFAVVINPYYPAADDDGLYDWLAYLQPSDPSALTPPGAAASASCCRG